MSIFLKSHNFRFVVSYTIRFHSNNSRDNLLTLLKTMPKETKHIAEAQKQRIKIKQRNAKYAPGKVTLQILGTGSKGAPRALYLFSDQSRYLFNCGEGTQRLAHEHKMKLAKLEHIFITQPTWKNIGGLPGTALTIQDVGVPQITLHGPPGLDELFVATRRFVIIRDLKIKMAECNENTIFEDNVMTVKYIPLSRVITKSGPENTETVCKNDEIIQATVEQLNASTSTIKGKRGRSRKRSSSSSSGSEDIFEDDIDYYAHERKRRRRRSHSRSRSLSTDSGKRTTPENVSVISQYLLRETKEKGISMAYICRLQPRPGALNLEKCVNHGVPAGPLLGRLKNGEDITLPNGEVVKSSDVCEPDDPGPLFIVVDCPSEDYFESLVTNEELKNHQKFAKTDEDVACLVIHFTPPDVMASERYQNWINDFPPSTQHIPINESNTCMGSIAVHRIQYKLHLLSKDLFPILGDKGTPCDSECAKSHANKKFKSDEIQMENLQIKPEETINQSPSDIATLSLYHLRPKKGQDNSSKIKLQPEEYINETMEMENFPLVLAELHQKLAKERLNSTVNEYPKLLFLGTGSCIPNKTRNTSGILLQTGVSQNILLDCGEGTYGQILRFFGPTKGEEVLSNLDAVYVSHLHADHHIGLIGVLQGRRTALKNLGSDKGPLYLFAPKQILAWLSFYDKCFESVKDEYILVPNGDLVLGRETYAETSKKLLLETLGLSEVNTCLVRHCPNAFGVALKHKLGYKLTYSGDTMPSENLVELGKDCDILIHEATMEDELSKEAVIKMHSTTSQAIEVGKQMQAKHIILTHFSQRYAKLPRFNDNFTENVSIAFDNMQIRLDDLSLVPYLYPALRIMFAEHYEELEHKAVKRQLKIEREASLDRSVKNN